jgi:hypothetical protein
LKRKYVLVKNCYHDKSDNPETQIYDELCCDFYEVVEIASKDEEARILVKNCLNQLKVQLLHKVTSGKSSKHIPGTYAISNKAIVGKSQECSKLRSPVVAKSKGRLPSTRIQSTGE